MTRDHYPILSEPAPNAFVALGYNGRGVAMATLIGRLLADRLAGVPEEEIVFPIRRDFQTFAFHRFWKLGVLARVASGRIQDAMEK
jgi:glycine/D-amino acid oxidase-like deaminating enzyme